MSDVIDLMSTAYMRDAYKCVPKTASIGSHEAVVAGLRAAMLALADTPNVQALDAAIAAFDKVIVFNRHEQMFCAIAVYLRAVTDKGET